MTNGDRRLMERATSVFAVVLLAFAGIYCTEKQRGDLVDQGTEAVVRNIAAAAGAGAFEARGLRGRRDARLRGLFQRGR